MVLLIFKKMKIFIGKEIYRKVLIEMKIYT